METEYYTIKDEQIFLNYESFYFDTILKTFYIPLSALRQTGVNFRDLRLPGDVFGFNIRGIGNDLVFFYSRNLCDSNQHIGWLFTNISTTPCSAILLK
jgi:hypothetical protein